MNDENTKGTKAFLKSYIGDAGLGPGPLSIPLRCFEIAIACAKQEDLEGLEKFAEDNKMSLSIGKTTYPHGEQVTINRTGPQRIYNSSWNRIKEALIGYRFRKQFPDFRFVGHDEFYYEE